jgi:hypothetical protein
MWLNDMALDESVLSSSQPEASSSQQSLGWELDAENNMNKYWDTDLNMWVFWDTAESRSTYWDGATWVWR